MPPSLGQRLHEQVASAHARLDRALVAFQTTREARTSEWGEALKERRVELRLAWKEWKATRFQVRTLA
jgi:hypothetical protein